MKFDGKLLFDISTEGKIGHSLPEVDVPLADLPPEDLLRDNLILPQVSEVELVRYFTYLSTLNYGVDSGFYPLGSCTMKYNPKVHEDLAALPGFAQIHPHQPVETIQGALAVMYQLQTFLAEISGMDGASLTPAAGAHGELAGMLMIKAYHKSRGQTARKRVLVPDSAHGTNPATASMCGFEAVTVKSDDQGNVDLTHLRSLLSEDIVGLTLTLPNTLGLFDPNILEITELVHNVGGLVYGDGANMNALLGHAKFGELGFDVVHMNLHKTFSTPHGGGGPGAGPVAAKGELANFLPGPISMEQREADTTQYSLVMPAQSIGRIGSFYGNFGILVRACAYIRSLGAQGLREVAENAVINGNYILSRLKGAYYLPYDRRCMHEVVFSGRWQREKGVRTLDIAKRIIDYGFYPPTIYFPLIVEEALMIEPTETESKATLDSFIEAMLTIAREVEENPEIVKSAPHDTPVKRLDEAKAARHPELRWRPSSSETRGEE